MSGIVARRAPIIPVLEHDEYVIPAPIEPGHIRISARPAIQSDRIGAEPGGEAHEHQCACGIARNLEIDLFLFAVQKKRNESVVSLEAGEFR